MSTPEELGAQPTVETFNAAIESLGQLGEARREIREEIDNIKSRFDQELAHKCAKINDLDDTASNLMVRAEQAMIELQVSGALGGRALLDACGMLAAASGSAENAENFKKASAAYNALVPGTKIYASENIYTLRRGDDAEKIPVEVEVTLTRQDHLLYTFYIPVDSAEGEPTLISVDPVNRLVVGDENIQEALKEALSNRGLPTPFNARVRLISNLITAGMEAEATSCQERLNKDLEDSFNRGNVRYEQLAYAREHQPEQFDRYYDRASLEVATYLYKNDISWVASNFINEYVYLRTEDKQQLTGQLSLTTTEQAEVRLETFAVLLARGKELVAAEALEATDSESKIPH